MKKNYKGLLLIILFVFVLGVSINASAAGTVTCNGVINQDLLNALNDYVYVPIKWATPILFILLTSVDFAKVVFAGKKEDMDKAKNNFMKRLVAALIIFFAPDIVKLLVDLVQQESIKACLNNNFK